MNGVNKTLYIPLYGKAYVSRRGLILDDPKAEEIWEKEQFPLKGKAKSRWLAYYMAMRGKVFDLWLAEKMKEYPGAAVLHLGCGMDSRCLRVGTRGQTWVDADFPEVISERRRYFSENGDYRMVELDLTAEGWTEALPEGERAIVVLEGVSMYLTNAQCARVLESLQEKYGEFDLLMDCYTALAARMSKLKNPVHGVGVGTVWGLDDPHVLESVQVAFVQEHDMTPEALSECLPGWEKKVFRRLYAGNFSKKLYRMYEYRGSGK